MTDSAPQIHMSKTAQIPYPNPYILMLNGEFREVAFCEERGPLMKGLWREKFFKTPHDSPLDLEIGTGNGNHFAYRSFTAPNRCLLGLELKYKPLIQSIRRAINGGAKNAGVIRYDARLLTHLFEPQELDNIYIHFPDPWSKRRQQKNRFLQKTFLDLLYRLQKPGSFIEFKTDSREYFDFAVEEIHKTPYEIQFLTYDLHQSEMQDQNFMTSFEKIFHSQGLPIHLAILKKSL